jgi:hypothetical protein
MPAASSLICRVAPLLNYDLSLRVVKAIAYDLTSEYNQSVLEIVESALTKLAAKTRKDSRSFKTLLLEDLYKIKGSKL